MDTSVYTNALEQRVQQSLSQIYSASEYNRRVWCRLRRFPSSQAYFEIRIHNLLPREQSASLEWARGLYKIIRRFPSTKGTLKVMFDSSKCGWSETRYGWGNSYTLGVDGYRDGPLTPQQWENLRSHGGLTVTLEGHFEAEELESELMVTVEWYYNAL